MCNHERTAVISGRCECGEPVPGVVHRASWRAMALSQAAARRELWREACAMRPANVIEKISLYWYLINSDSAKAVRPVNIQRCDLYYYRLYRSVARRREISAF